MITASSIIGKFCSWLQTWSGPELVDWDTAGRSKVSADASNCWDSMAGCWSSSGSSWLGTLVGNSRPDVVSVCPTVSPVFHQVKRFVLRRLVLLHHEVKTRIIVALLEFQFMIWARICSCVLTPDRIPSRRTEGSAGDGRAVRQSARLVLQVHLFGLGVLRPTSKLLRVMIGRRRGSWAVGAGQMVRFPSTYFAPASEKPNVPSSSV